MRKFTKVLASILAFVMIAAIGLGFNNTINLDATSATTYTRTTNSDNLVIRSQDGYEPESTYDRIGLVKPQDMVIDTVNGVEYGYILDKGNSENKPFILKFRLDSITNNTSSVEKISLTDIPYISSPSGLWIQTTTYKGVTRKEMYIADKSATYYDSVYTSFKYAGLIYRIQFDLNTDQLLLDEENVSIIHVPTQVNDADPSTDPSQIVNGKVLIKTPSYGQTTEFAPIKVAVDKTGNLFVASEGTAAGMVELTYSGEFVSFYVVNTVEYNFLYQIVKKIGTDEQLRKLGYKNPESFYNVFIDNNDLVYSVTKNIAKTFDKYSTSGTSILETQITFPNLDQDKELNLTDSYITGQGLIFISLSNGMIFVFSPDGNLIFYFGTKQSNEQFTPDIVGFFKTLEAIVVDKTNRIWALDSEKAFLQTFTPTAYSSSIFDAITYFNNQQYDASQKAWEEVLKYDSLSVLANDGLGKAYYYNQQYEESLKYFATSKNRSLYSNVFWELRNDFLQQNLTAIVLIAIGIIVLLGFIGYLVKNVPQINTFIKKVKNLKNTRFVKDMTVGFRLWKKPQDTFYDLKVGRQGSLFGATIHYILAIIAMLLNTYCYALPFQTVTTNTISVSTVFIATVAVLAVFILCNYLVSAINDGEGTFKDIYKFTGYSLLPMIICLPLAVGISYGLTLNESVVISFLQFLGFFGSGLVLLLGIINTHNYTFTQTIKNIILTIIFMVLFAIICVVVYVMIDQIVDLVTTIWKEVKLRAGWY